jgi:capsular exopolysaccharide synthesis family protein
MAMETAGLEQAAGQAPRENQFRYILNVGLRRWRLIAMFTIVASVGYGIFGLFQFKTEPHYVGTAQLRVEQSPWEKDLLKDVGGEPLFLNTPLALVERSSRHGLAEDLTRALIQQDIAEGLPNGAIITEEEFLAKVAEIESRVRVEPNTEAGMIQITTMAPDQQEAKRIAEFAARVFIDRNRQFLLDEEEETHDFVLQKLESVRKELDEADSRLWEFRKEMGFRTKDEVSNEIQNLTKEVISAETTQEEIRAKLGGIEEQMASKNEQLPMSIGQISDDIVTGLLAELNDLHRERIQLSVVWQPNQGPLGDLQARIEEKEQAILQAMQEVDAGVASGINVFEDRKHLRDQYLTLQLQLTSLDIQSSTDRRLINELEQLIPSLSEMDKDYQNMLREADQLRRQFDALLEKRLQIATGLNREQGYVERQNVATASAAPVEQQVRPWMNFVIGAFVGLVIGFGLAVMAEMNDTSIRSIEDVTDYIGLDVIGTIPQMRFGKPKSQRRGDYVAMTAEGHVDSCIVTQHDPKSPISEAYRTLRTTFQLATLHQKPKTVMVTSSVPAEGKTTTAVNMAVTFADSGLRVLVIDTDLRRPHVHHVLRMERGPGLADVLREGYDVHTVIRPTRIENLWIISSGRVPPNPSELIGSERMRKLLEQLGNEFDLVICDAPSMLVVTDPVLLATEVDTVVHVVSADHARRETVMRGKKLLETARANVAGVVLNNLKATRRHYYYYYYYYDESASEKPKRWYYF